MGRTYRLSFSALALLVPLTTTLAVPAVASSGSGVVQPEPSVTASDFPMEPAGTAPVDNDGLIPNPETPTGLPVGPPTSCTVSFTASATVTSATVNQWIASNENSLSAPATVCLSGTFGRPIHVWSKSSTEMLEIASAPGQAATLDLGEVHAADTNPNQYWSDSGGVSIVDSRSVEIYGLTVENFTFDGSAHVPAGIYVTVRSDAATTDQSVVPHLSACYLHGGACGDIYIIDDTVTDITNTADELPTTKSLCGNEDVGAYGIAVIAGGSSSNEALQHVVVEDDTVTGTRTGQSETVTLNGDLEDFLAYGNAIGTADNIGLDTIGWETGASQARHGLVEDNTVYDVDTYSNSSYGKWSGGICRPTRENAAGLYDDGGSYIWFDDNRVWNTNQGIDLDVETPGRETDHLLVSGNTVHDDPGNSTGDPSEGTEPPGVSGSSTVAGHDYVGLYLDAFGSKSTISDVYVHDNIIENESQHYLKPSDGMPVVDLGGSWDDIELWHNVIAGMGGDDRYNTLFAVDRLPSGGTDVVDCNDYQELSTSSDTVDGNFALPNTDWTSLAQWQKHNRHGWDAHSAVGGFASDCPSVSIQ